jgi:transposase
VIHFLQAEGHSAAEIHRRMSAVYGPNFMSDTYVREWCRKFHDGRTDMYDEGGQGRPSVVTDDLVQHVDKLVLKQHQFTISELLLEFPQVSRTVLYEIVTNNFTTTIFVPDGCQKCSLKFTKHREWHQL